MFGEAANVLTHSELTQVCRHLQGYTFVLNNPFLFLTCADHISVQIPLFPSSFHFILFSYIPPSLPLNPPQFLLTSFCLSVHPYLLGLGTETFLTWTYLLC